MTEATHEITFNGDLTIDFLDTFRSHRDELARVIGRLDGVERFAVKLGAYPPGQKSISVPHGWRPDQYIQCAGRGDELAIEIHRQNPDGSFAQLAVGRGGPHDGGPDVRVPFGDGHSVVVYDDEVFGQAEAVEIFHRYFETGKVGDAYVLRTIDLS